MSSETKEHLPCPWCQYDLFGLPTNGNIVRCPECGNRSDLRLLRIAPDKRAERLRGMEALPKTSAGLFTLTLGLAVLAVTSIGGGADLPYQIPLALGFAWAASVYAFLRRYAHVTGALRALAFLHVCMVLACAGGMATFMGACSAYVEYPVNPFAIITAMGGLVTLAGSRWAYRRAYGMLNLMHDQLAG